MSDLIDRQAAKLAIIEKGQASKRYKIGEFWELNRNEIWDALDGVPSAHPLDPCETCLHKGKGWDEDPCDGCTGTESKYNPMVSPDGTLIVNVPKGTKVKRVLVLPYADG